MTALTIFYLIALFMLGAIMGSFLNVVAVDFMNLYMKHDLEHKSEWKFFLSHWKSKQFWQEVFDRRSACDTCEIKLTPKELVPVVSYLWQKGKCNSCEVKFSPQHLYVELLCGVIFTGVFLAVFSSYTALSGLFIAEILYMFVFFGLAIIILLFDIEHQIIPDVLVHSLVLLAFGAHMLGFLSVPQVSLLNTAIAAIAVALPLFLFWLASKGTWMGMADSKLGLAMGALLGVSLGITSFFFSFWIGALVAIALWAVSRFGPKNDKEEIGMKTAIAFGPYMVLAVWLIYVTKINLFPFV